MSLDAKNTFSRRAFLAGTAATLGAPALAQTGPNTIEMENEITQSVRRNISSFRAVDWRPHFSSLRNGAILVDISSRALHFWDEDGQTKFLFPSSIPMSEELTRRGRTRVVRKVEGPDWRPTPSMLERNPDWPKYVPPGPDNPLGSRALYLFDGGRDTYLRIHGTPHPRSIGGLASSGCVRMVMAHINTLYDRVDLGSAAVLYPLDGGRPRSG